MVGRRRPVGSARTPQFNEAQACSEAMRINLSTAVARCLVGAWFVLIGSAVYFVANMLLVSNEGTLLVGKRDMFWLGSAFVVGVAALGLPLLGAAAALNRGPVELRPAARPVSGVGFILYAASVGVSSALLSLVTLVAAGPLIGGERFEEIGLTWLFALPVFLACAGLSWPVYQRYRKSSSWITTLSLFLGNMLAASGIGLSATWMMLHGS